jgi:hypothetical protein
MATKKEFEDNVIDILHNHYGKSLSEIDHNFDLVQSTIKATLAAYKLVSEKVELAQYAVYEHEPAHGKDKNGVILAPFKTREEAEKARVDYGYVSDNYYVGKL